MKNPLNKRIPKEIRSELGKYLVIFLFMTLTIGFISGFLVADNSIIKTFDESYQKYNIEDGNFELENEADADVIAELEKNDVTIYKNYYIEESSVNDGKLRIYKNRNDVDKVCIMDGKLADSDNEIAIDRMYADNNKISLGDTINVGGKELKVTGFVALSDYSALFEKNSDMMFDAVKFGVAIMNDAGFESYQDKNLHYNYSWIYKEAPKDESDERVKSDDFLKVLNQNTEITNYVPRYENQAINFTKDDFGGDKGMMITLLVILLVIMAFVFGVTASNTITKEASVIGTLRASGYTKGELVRHYMSMPVAVTLVAALTGNILGYTVFNNMVESMYYGSYSLTKFETLWNGEAFLITTVAPVIIMIVINYLILIRKLSLSPLKFIRNDLSRKKNKKAVKLPEFKFMRRFRLRIIFQNVSGYITMFIGVVFANILLMFGMMLGPLLTHYQNECVDNMISKYQYILKAPVEVNDNEAEKYCVTSLQTIADEYKSEDVSVYGVNEKSEYIKQEIKNDEVYISDGYAEKYGLKAGDKIKLKKKYEDGEYEFKVTGIYYYPSAIAVFMDREHFNTVFDKDKDSFNGYFSNNELTDLDEKYIASTITVDDVTKVSRQLDVSMGNMFYMVTVFAVVLFVILIYLLSKLIIEKNSNSISMVKILGYSNGEISRLYLLSTTIIVIVSLLISLPLNYQIIKFIYKYMMMDFTGWFSMYIENTVYVKMFLLGFVSYAFIAVLQFIRIKKIPMHDALKNVD